MVALKVEMVKAQGGLGSAMGKVYVVVFIVAPVRNPAFTTKVEGSGVKLSRDIKINFHKYLPEHDKSIYMDANINQLEDVNKSYDSDMIAMKHPARDCIYQEVKACLYRGKDIEANMTKQINRYKAENYPDNNGLISAGVMFRKNNQKVIDLMELWWSEVEKGSHRDQLSFNYCLWKKPIDIEYMVYSKGFKINKHK